MVGRQEVVGGLHASAGNDDEASEAVPDRVASYDSTNQLATGEKTSALE